jgi:hypothetical protein
MHLFKQPIAVALAVFLVSSTLAAASTTGSADAGGRALKQDSSSGGLGGLGGQVCVLRGGIDGLRGRMVEGGTLELQPHRRAHWHIGVPPHDIHTHIVCLWCREVALAWALEEGVATAAKRPWARPHR